MNTAKSEWRQLVSGILIGLVSVATVLAGILLSLQAPGGPAPTSIALATSSATIVQTPTLPATASPTLAASPTSTTSPATPGSTATPTPPGPTATPAPVVCLTPFGWSAYIVRAGDSLESIASRTGTDVFTLIQNNCLIDTDLRPGQILYVPPAPTRGPTPTREPCYVPLNWVPYRVQPGDTLYALAVRYGTTVNALVRSNCLTSYTLFVGKVLYVPPVAATLTRVPSATPTPSPVLPSPTASATGIAPSPTPTPTLPVVPTTPPPTTSPSVTPPSETPSPTSTPQPPTPTPTPTTGITPSPTVQPSATAPPSATPPPIATAISSPTQIPPSSTP